MVTACGKQPIGSGCTIANLFRTTSCLSISTGSRRFQRRDPGRAALFCGCRAASIRTGAITPLLGGVGPMTIMSLMHNALIAASMWRGLGVRLLRQMRHPFERRHGCCISRAKRTSSAVRSF
ncbi:hypothetical protein HFN60_10585 [Rhizobium leguminosarum]|nr:hypothetical protein [Rhizobium leguminosarum]MBY5816099.1 hypothetical protein [Rhizobium leguminosarum]NKL75281.1 hypothetical protein [Rhizobium leguminosarum bv. viciae]